MEFNTQTQQIRNQYDWFSKRSVCTKHELFFDVYCSSMMCACAWLIIRVLHVGVWLGTETIISECIVQCSPPNSNLWGTQTEFDLSDFLNYENSF